MLHEIHKPAAVLCRWMDTMHAVFIIGSIRSKMPLNSLSIQMDSTVRTEMKKPSIAAAKQPCTPDGRT